MAMDHCGVSLVLGTWRSSAVWGEALRWIGSYVSKWAACWDHPGGKGDCVRPGERELDGREAQYRGSPVVTEAPSSQQASTPTLMAQVIDISVPPPPQHGLSQEATPR